MESVLHFSTEIRMIKMIDVLPHFIGQSHLCLKIQMRLAIQMTHFDDSNSHTNFSVLFQTQNTSSPRCSSPNPR